MSEPTPRIDPHDDDPLAARLRAALTSEADMVNPSDDGLQRIRSGMAAGGRPWWRHPAALAVAAALVLGLAAGSIAALLGGNDPEENIVAGEPSVSTSASETSAPSSTAAEPTEATDSPMPVEGDVYVYYIRDDETGPRLYREQRPNIGMEPAQAALAMMLGEPALDPDYFSAWPVGTELLAYSVSGDTATVDLSAFPAAGGQSEEVGVQQLVYTVSANDDAVEQVRLLVNGKEPQSGHADLSEPVTRAAKVDVQGPIWLLTPSEGATEPSTVTITGYGTAFEGTVSWEVRRAGSDEVVAEGFTSAGANGEFAEFSDEVELAPGTYEIRAFESSAEDGRPLHVDSKTFTVQ